MKTLDELVAEAKASRAPAQVHNFQLAHDYETVKRFTAMVHRICRKGDPKELAACEQWLHPLYDLVSRREGEVG